MSIMRPCPECELTYAVSEFAPRDNSVYEREEPPTFELISRQSRCPECNRIHGRRRRFVLDLLIPRAEDMGIRVVPVKGSAFRRLALRPGRRATREAAGLLRALMQEFNDALPDARCDRGRHGVTVESAADRGRQPTQVQLFSARSRRST